MDVGDPSQLILHERFSLFTASSLRNIRVILHVTEPFFATLGSTYEEALMARDYPAASMQDRSPFHQPAGIIHAIVEDGFFDETLVFDKDIIDDMLKDMPERNEKENGRVMLGIKALLGAKCKCACCCDLLSSTDLLSLCVDLQLCHRHTAWWT